MLEKLFGLVSLADTQTSENANQLATKILNGIKTVGPWICGILAVVAVGVTLMKVVQFVLAKNQGNDQGAEPAKKGIIWGIVAITVFALFSFICGFIIEIANAFGASIPTTTAIALFQNLGNLGLF